MKVLVADDDPLSSDIAQRLLQRFGAEVVLATDGAEAARLLIEAAAAGAGFDLAFFDLDMPIAGGREAARRVRAAGLGLPLVALSGSDEGGLAASGIDRLLLKPYSLEELREVLSALAGF